MNARPFADRAPAVTALFSAFGIAGFIFLPAPWPLKAPNAVFYALLCLNTFLSVRYFDHLPPLTRDERLIDGTLALTYLALAAAIGSPVAFGLAGLALFVASIAKYALLLPVLDDPSVLPRKIWVNTAGCLMCAVTALGAWLGDGLWFSWVETAAFAAANLYVLRLNPLYADARP